ncbi:MAD2L1-binding protein [Collichthys lucidus]|uniref:MAD2L1-binding protein n=1 Tax=Collichthys lucidus TaxID=240159 RepID=A0A4U5VBV1_COLLU|nr:MAD2L1-binding protein [Collichthys lucidus]
MAEVSNIFKPTLNSEDEDNTSTTNNGDKEIKRRLSFSSDKDVSTLEEANTACKVSALQSVPHDSNSRRLSAEIADQLSLKAVNTRLKANNAAEHPLNSKHHVVNNTEDKENTATTITSEDADAEVVRRAQEEGHVTVVFPGTVTQEGCCRFVSEILKCILYQRQQLPMTYDQLVYSQKKQQASMQDKDIVSRRPIQSADMDWRKCQQTLQELEEVLQQLEVLFSLSRVPRVLLLIGGSLILPKELYEINMESLVVAGGDQLSAGILMLKASSSAHFSWLTFCLTQDLFV